MKSHQVLVTGATGFIGRALCQKLVDEGCQVYALSRDCERARNLLPESVSCYQKLTALAGIEIDTVINLAGEPLMAGRWTKTRKQQFYQSRIGTTDALYDYFVHAPIPPRCLINGSAIGYYGPHRDEELTEDGLVVNSFSHRLCDAWESSARRFHDMGTRVCLLRTGVVLGEDGGALASMTLPFKLGLGGRLGDGNQWFSWIHRDDLIGIILHCMNHKELHGPINGTAPVPVTNRELTQTLAATLHRPAFMAVPNKVMKLMLGEMAEEILLTGQRVIPKKALESGYQFIYPELSLALKQLFAK